MYFCNVIGDEFHYLFNCPLLVDGRIIHTYFSHFSLMFHGLTMLNLFLLSLLLYLHGIGPFTVTGYNRVFGPKQNRLKQPVVRKTLRSYTLISSGHEYVFLLIYVMYKVFKKRISTIYQDYINIPFCIELRISCCFFTQNIENNRISKESPTYQN
jgi:hypothetical protein